VRSASLFDRVADTLPEQQVASRPQLALRDLELLDGALAEAAHWAGVPVTDLDTVAARPSRLTGLGRSGCVSFQPSDRFTLWQRRPALSAGVGGQARSLLL
jgi:hypothetical protein